jgi:hypothetical protein
MGAKGGLDLEVMSLIQEFRKAYDFKQIVIAELTRDHGMGLLCDSAVHCTPCFPSAAAPGR